MKTANSISRRFFLTSIAASLGTCYMAPASAQFVVFDPANFVQTTITAIKQVAAYALQIKQWEEIIKSNMAKLADLEGILSMEMAGGIASSLLGYTTQLEDTLKDGLQVADTLKSWYGASKKSPEEFMKSLAKQKASGDQRVSTLLDHFQATGAAIQESHTSLQKIGNNLSKINGPTEGLQAVAASIGILVKQQSSIMSFMQLEILDKAQDQAKKNQSIEGHEVWEANYKKRMDAAIK
jgi:P-type conjugative transfer protein TrbJ